MKTTILTLLLACALRGDELYNPDGTVHFTPSDVNFGQTAELYVTNSTVFWGTTNYLPPWFGSTNTAPAVLRWDVKTNVSEFNVSIRLDDVDGFWVERTQVVSNLIATIEWKGTTNTMILEHHQTEPVLRKYRLETVRKYIEP